MCNYNYNEISNLSDIESGLYDWLSYYDMSSKLVFNKKHHLSNFDHNNKWGWGWGVGGMGGGGGAGGNRIMFWRGVSLTEPWNGGLKSKVQAQNIASLQQEKAWNGS